MFPFSIERAAFLANPRVQKSNEGEGRATVWSADGEEKDGRFTIDELELSSRDYTMYFV